MKRDRHHFEVPACAGAYGMNYALRNAFSIEMGKLLQMMDILDQLWASGFILLFS